MNDVDQRIHEYIERTARSMNISPEEAKELLIVRCVIDYITNEEGSKELVK